MADTVSSKVIVNERSHYVIRLTNKSDGTGESAVLKVDRSTLVDLNGEEPRRLIVDRVLGHVDGMNVSLLFDATTDDLIGVFSGFDIERDFRDIGGLPDPLSAGNVGDLLLTTTGHGVGDSYDLTIYLRLEPKPH